MLSRLSKNIPLLGRTPCAIQRNLIAKRFSAAPNTRFAAFSSTSSSSNKSEQQEQQQEQDQKHEEQQSQQQQSTKSRQSFWKPAGFGAALLASGWFGFGTKEKTAAELAGNTEVKSDSSEIYEDAILTVAPNVPPPITRRHPVTLRVQLESTVMETPLTNKYKYRFWGYNGSVPGPMIRARVGDVMEFTHINKDDSGMAHNVDFHAVTGPGGGTSLNLVEKDGKKTARHKLLNPGLYVYHCAAAPLPVHVANGMYGLILVEPEEGLPKVDREFYVFQSEFYFDSPEHGATLIEECSYANGLREQPDAVVFNGKEGSMTNKEVLKANTNERVRIFFGNGGPNLTSSFHVIGAIFDKVYRDADFISPPARNVQTVTVPPGGATVVEWDTIVPGNYTLVDHAIFRVDKGCVGFLSVTGPPRPDIYSSKQMPENCVGCKLHA